MRFTRRSFLVTAGASIVVAACGGSDDEGQGAAGTTAGGADTTTDDGGTTPEGVYDLVRRFPTTALVPGTVRMPISLGRDGEALSDGPEELVGRIVDEQGAVVVDDVRATKRKEGLPHAYWPFIADIDAPGIYTLLVDGAAPQGAAFQVNDPASVAIPLVGEPLPPFATPTTDNGRGVDPICTRDPECPLHDHTLTEALEGGTPVAYLVGTPAYCQTGVCGPILDLLLELREELGDKVAFVHSEIYTDDTLKEVAPAVLAYNLDFEPLLFVTDASGILIERLDAVFDKSEMRDALTKALT